MSRISRDANRPLVERLIRALGPIEGIGARIDWLTREWLGRPYRECPLDGGPEVHERLTASLDGFDCVTYVEAVLALGGSTSVTAYLGALSSIRYRDGVVGWATRNHYMSAWIRENERQGFVRDITRGPGLVRRRRRLSVVPGVPVRNVTVTSLPKALFLRRTRDVRTGDLVFFASTRRNLDIFHCGVLIRVGDSVHMRHAARSRGAVVEQELQQFLARNRMPGVILVRPEEAFPGAS